ncbi:hypothetical protein E2C01_045048 [Portunus trituberculatus]|uniref:Uncharacterized protein n=1 Tax=Portunus trituberculatus TaxID=210409 RepID=A0A5B7G012_PORTR|nr:hypothetical protein [Portunus trituberculatus]
MKKHRQGGRQEADPAEVVVPPLASRRSTSQRMQVTSTVVLRLRSQVLPLPGRRILSDKVFKPGVS